MSNLVIIEAPNKIKKIKEALGAGYDVYATKGHFRDLPEDGLNVDIDNNFEPTYAIDPEKKELVRELVDKAKKADVVYLMTDCDREGEAIAWHLSETFPKSVKQKRAAAQSLEKSAIKKAIEGAREIDKDLVESQQARRILDRICGYKTSYLVKRATGGMSAGRVQTAALRVLADREKEIQEFKPEEYWPVEAELLTKDMKKVLASIKYPDEKDIKNGEMAKKVVAMIKKGPAVVSKFEKKDVATRAQAPFTTSSMYQSAAAVFGWKSDKTASIAQKLYEAGVISYHRTDSTFIVPEVVSSIRGLIESDYGSKYLPAKPNFFGAAKNAQEAHEACRVVHLEATEYTSGDGDEARLYKMIWKRTVASQMADMQKLSIAAEFMVDKCVLKANGSKLMFDGWFKVWDYSTVSDTELPEMKVGDELQVLDVKTEQKFTSPPPRYTEQSLIKKLEAEGIGRPSTYASISKTLEKRAYIENKKSITVTPLGMKVIDFMSQVGFCFAEVKFTADLEQKLDDIAEKRKDRLSVLNEFWTRLKSDINKSKEFKKEKIVTEFDCPECAEKGITAKLCLRESRFGKFFSCENASTKEEGCKYKANYGKDGKPEEKVKKEVKVSEHTCPLCGSNLVVRVSKKTGKEFLACKGWPKCNPGIFTLDGEKIEFKKKVWKKKEK